MEPAPLPADPPPRRGVCVVRAERQATAGCLITVTVTPDIWRPHEQTQRHFVSRREAIAYVQRFLQEVAEGEGPPSVTQR